MTREEFFNILRLSAKEFFFLWKGGLIFLIIVMAAVLAGFALSGTVFMEIILFSMFLGILWFFPFMKNHMVIRAFVGMVFLYILANIVLGDNLLNSLGRLGSAIKDRSAITTDAKTNGLRHLTLKSGTALFSKNGVGGFTSITYHHSTENALEVIDLGKKVEDNGVVYAKILLPRESKEGNYMSGVFDSTSEIWWIQAETISLPSPLSPKNHHPKGWVELATPGPDEKDFWPVATPTDAVGKTTATFKELIVAVKVNGEEVYLSNPKKILVFSAGLRPGGLPDLKFAHPPSQGKIRAKFQ